MHISVDDSRFTGVTQLKAFIKGTQGVGVAISGSSISDKYKYIDALVDRVRYPALSRKHKRVVLAFLKKVTGYKKAQLARLIVRAGRGDLETTPYHREQPVKIYKCADIKLLETTDELHHRLSERATREILRREYEMFGKKDYQTISQISHSHISNLRKSPEYKNDWVNHTHSRILPIGFTRKPDNLGMPGSIRVDTVHQNDVYHLNAVDEITQWEVVVCIPSLKEETMAVAVQILLDQFPFVIFNFHSDRGGETINYYVAGLLTELLITQTKSRPRHTTDNPLIESKNGSVIRKNFGYGYLPKSAASIINQYYQDYFNIYLNYHRPCGYPTLNTDSKGKVKRSYITYLTPFEKLKSHPKIKACLKPGITVKSLNQIAYQYSDNEFARVMRLAERKLNATIKNKETDISLTKIQP